MKRPHNGTETPTKSTEAGRPKWAAATRGRGEAARARKPLRSDTDDVPSLGAEVTYKPPTKNGRWPKGKSGNKKGRTKGSKNKKTVIIEMMEAKLGRKIPDPKKLSRYEGMMFKAIQKALGGDIRAMGFVLTEYRKAIESSGSGAAAATTEEDEQAYAALCEKLRREIEEELRKEIRDEILRELKK